MEKHILLAVDDRPDNLYVLQTLIAEHLQDCDLMTASSGEEGLSMALDSDLDGILVDVQMPGISGIEMCRWLKSDERTAHVPVILITARDADAKLKEEGLQAGADDFLTKPISNIELIAKIRVMLRIKHARDELSDINAHLDQLVAEKTQSLRVSEEQYRAISEDMPMLICRFLPGGEITYINEAYCKYFEKTFEELVGSSFLSPIPEADRETVMANISMLGCDSPMQLHEHRVIAPDGEIHWQRWTNHALFDAKGKAVAYQSIGEDITERKRVEDALQESYEIIEQNFHTQNIVSSVLHYSLEPVTLKEILEHTLDTILSEPIFFLQNKGSIFLAENGSEMLDLGVHHNLPVSLQEACAKVPFGRCLCGRAASSREIIFAGDVDKLHETSYDGMPPHGHYCVPIRSGKRVLGVINAYVNAGHTRTSKEEEFLTMMADTLAGLIERKQAEAAVQKAHAELEQQVADRTKELLTAKKSAEQANLAKSQFLASMSHELRTPLNAILGYSEMITEDAEARGQMDMLPDLKKISSAGQHLLGLISDLLDLSKIEAGKMEPLVETFNILTMINEVAEGVLPLIKQNGNELELSCAVDAGEMSADVTKVRQILFNLLSNAAKFTEQGVINLRVSREREKEGDWLTFRVSDTGIGIDPKQMTNVFGAFTQAKLSITKEYGGTGLGLAICKHYCKMMGGEITVKSELGEGSTFTVRLPAKVAGEVVETDEAMGMPAG